MLLKNDRCKDHCSTFSGDKFSNFFICKSIVEIKVTGLLVKPNNKCAKRQAITFGLSFKVSSYHKNRNTSLWVSSIFMLWNPCCISDIKAMGFIRNRNKMSKIRVNKLGPVCKLSFNDSRFVLADPS